MKRVFPIVIFVFILAGVVAGWVLLPDPVSVAFGFKWEHEKWMPKLMALGVSLAIGGLGAYQAAAGGKEAAKGGYIMQLIAAVVLVLLFWVNR